MTGVRPLPEPYPAHLHGGLGLLRDLRFAEDVRHVVTRRLLTEHRPLDDGPVGEALGDEDQHFPLPVSEVGKRPV